MEKKITRKKAPKNLISAEQAREQRVAEEAYYLAEQRGFAPGGELDDWFRAANMVDLGAQAGIKG